MTPSTLVSAASFSGQGEPQPGAATSGQFIDLPANHMHENFEHHQSSSLLWADSEDFFQSLTSLDGMAWDQTMPALTYSASIPDGDTHLRQRARPRPEESSPAKDGHRAVLAVNGIISETASEPRPLWA